jgi:hypothetical protein
MARTQTERLSEKTVERQFLYELERDFELAPATSRAVLEAAKQVLLSSGGNGGVREGQIRVTAVSVDEPAGKPLGAMKKIGVVLTMDGGLEDLEVIARFGATRLRRLRLLQTDVRTIRRDVAALRGRGVWVPTRGMVKQMGRGQSHKAKIVELYLCGMTYTEIMRRTRHSASAIKRYVESFGRVVVLWGRGVRCAREIGYVLGVSERLALEYLKLRERYGGEGYRDRIDEIARQVRRVLGPNGAEKGGSQ